MIEQIIRLLSDKARWFDCVEISGSSTPLSYKNNRFYSITERQDSGYGVRVNINGRTGFSYTNDGGKIKDAIDRARQLAAYGDIENFTLPSVNDIRFEPYSASIDQFDVHSEMAKAEEAIHSILAQYPKATVDVGVSRSIGSLRIVNSSGIDISYKNSHYAASISTTLIQDDGSKIDTWESVSALSPLSYTGMHQKILRKIESALTTRKLSSGTIPVVLSPKAFSRIIGIVTAGLNAKSVCKGISPFADKRGSDLFNASLTIHDDPCIVDSPYSCPFDDEGIITRAKSVIREGRIERFITDLKHAEKLDIAPEGNGSRGYSSLPAPSFCNILIEAGSEQYPSMLRSITKGILAEQFIGLGQSNTLTGDFSANLDLAYLIENGEITGRVKDCMISGNLFKLLADDIMLSAERERSGSVLAPYVLFPSVNYTG